MPLEKQVVRLELAKKLKELGVKQSSLYCYSFPKGIYAKVEPLSTSHYGVNYDEYAAFTVAELGEMLPSCVYGENKSIVSIRQIKGTENYGLYGSYSDGTIKVEMLTAPTEADARAKMLIYLLENKLIKTI